MRKKKAWAALLCAGALLCTLCACGAAGTKKASEDYSSEDAVSLTFSSGGITADGSGSGYTVDGTALSISEPGTYILSGTCEDGSVTVKKGTQGVTLVLNGLALTSADTAPITCNKSTEVTLLAAQGTENTLADSEQNNDETYPDNTGAENAVIKCKDGSAVTLGGSGTLHITAKGKNGIKSGAATDTEGEASLTVRDLTLEIEAGVNDAINAEALLHIESGTLTLSAGDDALHCDRVLTVGAAGTEGPAITVTDCYEGLEGAEVSILSGNIGITSQDDCINAANSDLSGYAFSLTISGGTVNAYSAGGDGFDSNGDLTISGGTVAVWTASTADDQPLDADGTLTLSGGTVLAAGGSSGMGLRITATQPYVTFGASAMGGAPMGGGDLTPPAAPAEGKAPALEGTRPSASFPEGGPEKGERPFAGGQRTAAVPEGTAFTLRAADGTAVCSGTAVCGASYVLYSSPELTEGTSYTLAAADSDIETAAAQTGTAAVMDGIGGGRSGPPAGGGTPPAAPGGSGESAAPAKTPEEQG